MSEATETKNKLVVAALALIGVGGGYWLWNKNKVSAKPQAVPPNGMTFDPGMDASTQTAVNNALMSETNPTNLRQLAMGLRSKGYLKSAAALEAKAASIDAVNSPPPAITPISSDSGTTPVSAGDVPAALGKLITIANTTPVATGDAGMQSQPGVGFTAMSQAQLMADKALEAPMTILQVQKGLNIIYPTMKLVEDGANGPKTTAGIKTFQTNSGLDIDGIPGPMTWKALRKTLTSLGQFVG